MACSGVFGVNANILRGFCHRSREWSRATRGMELFEMAAADLSEFADADSGFFVYRKRVLTEGMKPQTPRVYASWGVFAHDEERLQDDVDHALNQLDLLNPLMEQWMLTEDMPSDLQEAWKRVWVTRSWHVAPCVAGADDRGDCSGPNKTCVRAAHNRDRNRSNGFVRGTDFPCTGLDLDWQNC